MHSETNPTETIRKPKDYRSAAYAFGCQHDMQIVMDGVRQCTKCGLMIAKPSALTPKRPSKEEIEKAYRNDDYIPAPWDLGAREMPSRAELWLTSAGVAVLAIGVVASAVGALLGLILGRVLG